MPDLIEVDASQLAEFRRELASLMTEVANGAHARELSAAGVVVPAGFTASDIKVVPAGGQPVAAQALITLAINYSPLVVLVGKDIWAWAWPKLRDVMDGAAKKADPED